MNVQEGDTKSLFQKEISVWALVFAFFTMIIVIAIFLLTEQLPDVSAAESNVVNDFLVKWFGDISFLYDKQTGLWLGIHIRHWAHTTEFFLLGIFASLTIWFTVKPAILKTGIISTGFCTAASLVDQCHKLLVPGRHFDSFDLLMDAAGYVVAVLMILIICEIFVPRLQCVS